MLKGGIVATPHALGLAIIHSIQPAFYQGELDELKKIIDKYLNEPSELRRAIQSR
jgi:hypothetical protein